MKSSCRHNLALTKLAKLELPFSSTVVGDTQVYLIFSVLFDIMVRVFHSKHPDRYGNH